MTIRLNQARVERLRIGGATFDERLENVAMQAFFAGTRLEIVSLSGRRNDLEARIGGHVDFVDFYPLDASVEWSLAERPISGSGTFTGDLETLAFEHELRLPRSITATGRLLGLTRQPGVQAIATWSDFEWQAGDNGTYASRAGTLRLSGDAKGFDADIQGLLLAPGLPELAVTSRLTGDLDTVQIERLEIDGFGGSIAGSGQLGRADLLLSLQLTGSDLDPATLRPGLRGRIGARAAVDARLPDRLSVDIRSIDGEFLGQPVSGAARLKLADAEWSLADSQISVADNRLRFDGSLIPRLTGRVEVDANDLGRLWPGLQGSILGGGTIGGSLEAPVGQVEFRGENLSYLGQHIGTLMVDGKIDARRQVSMRIRAEELASGDTLLGAATARLTGTLAEQQVSMNLAGGAGGLSVEGRGGWNGEKLAYRIDAAALDLGPAGPWVLAAPFDLRAAASDAAMGAHCWVQDAARLCLRDASLRDADFRIGGRLEQFPLAGIGLWLGEDFSVAGTADAKFSLRREGSSLRGRLAWTQYGTRIDYRESEQSVISTTIDEIALDVAADEDQTAVTGKMQTNLGITAELDATVTPSLSREAAVAGRLNISAPDIGESMPLLNRFVELNRVQGQLDARLDISGTLGMPRIQGDARLSGGSIAVPQSGIEIEDIELALTGSNGEPVSVSGRAQSGGGDLNVSGKLDYTDATGAFADLKVSGSEFQVMRMPDQSVYVSPDLHAFIDNGQILVDGTILIPRAEIVVDVLPETAAAPSPDAVVESSTVTRRARQAPFEIVGDLDLLLGDEVRFAGFGIDTRLIGGLKISRKPGEVNAVAEGNLRTTDGQFSAYRKQLTIDRGTLIFIGSLTDPNIDVRASRSLTYEGQAVTVGVLLTGQLSAMQTKIFSEPAMNEADALSYLVLNRPLRQAEGSDSADLSNAALALGISQALPVTQTLEESLGLDEIALEGTSEDTTALVAGRRLGEDVYIRYAYGLFNRIGTFIIRYDLRGGVSIEAGSGEEQTLDLIYSIRR